MSFCPVLSLAAPMFYAAICLCHSKVDDLLGHSNVNTYMNTHPQTPADTYIQWPDNAALGGDSHY